MAETKTEAIYLKDSYLKEFEANVTKVTDSKPDSKFILLDQTAFYPNSGGQPYDTGVMIRKSDGKEFKVVFVGKFDGEISHEVQIPEGVTLNVGDKIIGKIDWERRYSHMKAHTAAHIVSEAFYRKTGALITGNQLSGDESRVDGNFEYSPELIQHIFSEANSIVKKDLPVSVSFMDRDDAEKLPQMTKLAKGLPPDMKVVRIITIGDYETGADGGTHVKSTGEIGNIAFVKYNSKGKDNKRIYFKTD
jgi:Ser-tRNA(Ala) deacylase AlaX